MALRSRSRTTAPTSGPGRGPGSDGRAHHRPRHPRAHARRHQASAADVLRLRAETLFAERAEARFAEGATERQAWGNGPPRADRDVGESRSGTSAGSGIARPSGPAVVGDVDALEPAATGGAWRERVVPALRERMPLWLQARCGLERRSVAALGVLLLVAVVFAAQHFWTGRTEPVRAPEVVRAAAPYGTAGAKRSAEASASTGPQATGPQATGGTGAGTGAAVVVDVGGKVRNPGLQRLPAGSRVADALRAAGGVRPGTDTDGLNRARLLVDGEQIVVGGPAPAPGTGPALPAAGGSAAPGTPVSLSTATVDQLDALPGVGPVLAQHIVDYRSQHGGFRSVDELRQVNGIGARRFADLRNLVRP
ncbi:ComEA family DNA-binding protein [Streptomyces cynarae]|uniref:ComEA family DNA-binding protein n=1 Tax=Streptomyces cynarae TaxID=2981134 RepID=A0ABY6E013_9ACTN|nr:ComEA family DNA-binding protein [Streptomyces cynarae]UXY19728.1 ComEA family DNA-binding protein [Streptomyces cynarae]